MYGEVSMGTQPRDILSTSDHHITACPALCLPALKCAENSCAVLLCATLRCPVLCYPASQCAPGLIIHILGIL